MPMAAPVPTPDNPPAKTWPVAFPSPNPCSMAPANIGAPIVKPIPTPMPPIEPALMRVFKALMRALRPLAGIPPAGGIGPMKLLLPGAGATEPIIMFLAAAEALVAN